MELVISTNIVDALIKSEILSINLGDKKIRISRPLRVSSLLKSTSILVAACRHIFYLLATRSNYKQYIDHSYYFSFPAV